MPGTRGVIGVEFERDRGHFIDRLRARGREGVRGARGGRRCSTRASG